jgi:hypothetical protein
MIKRKTKYNRNINFKKKKYIFNNIGHLLFFRRHSNIFLVLLNNKKQHIVTLTAGSCLLGKKKKDKLAVHQMPKMINKLLLYFTKYNIKHIYLYVRHRLSGHFFNLKKLLMKNNI